MSSRDAFGDSFRDMRRIFGSEFMRHHVKAFDMLKTMRPLLAQNQAVLQSFSAPATREALLLLTAQNADLLRNVRAASNSLARITAITEQLRPALERFQAAWLTTLPPNWEGRRNVEDIRILLDFMEETGWCLVWTPRSDVIEELLTADVSGRSAALLRNEDSILDDLDACLDDVDRAEVQDLREALSDALRAYRSGSPFSSQAAATTVLTAAIHVHLGIPTFREARETFGEKTAMDVGMGRFRIVAILRVAYEAIAEFRGKPGETLPVTFNRHASVHRVAKEQFNRTNALVALMLVVPLVRELNHLFAVQAAEELDEDAA